MPQPLQGSQSCRPTIEITCPNVLSWHTKTKSYHISILSELQSLEFEEHEEEMNESEIESYFDKLEEIMLSLPCPPPSNSLCPLIELFN